MFEILLDENSEADKLEKASAGQQAGQQRAHAGHPPPRTVLPQQAPPLSLDSDCLTACGSGQEGDPLGKVNKNRPKVKHFGKFPNPGYKGQD